MKKLIFFLLFASNLYAQAPVHVASFNVRSNRLASDGLNIAGRGTSAHIFTWGVQSGVFDSCTISVQTSPNNITWTTQATLDCLSGGTSDYLIFVANWIRVNATTFTVQSGTAEVTVNYAGYIIAPTDIATITTAPLNNQNINNIRNCSNFSGANAGIKNTACVADIPSTGGIANATGFEGNQTWSTDIFSGVTKPIYLKLGASTTTISTNITIPHNVIIEFSKGAKLCPSAGITLTIQGGIVAGPYTIFCGDGTILFGTPATDPFFGRFGSTTNQNQIPVVYPQWFGALGDDSNDDGPAINKAIAAAVAGNHAKIKLIAGIYKTTISINLTRLWANLIFEGDGQYRTRINAVLSGDYPAVDLTGSAFLTLRNFTIYSRSGSQSVLLQLARHGTDAYDPGGTYTNASSQKHHIEHITVDGIASRSIVVVSGSEENVWLNNTFSAYGDKPVFTAEMFDAGDSLDPLTSAYTTVATGDGGVGLNTFIGNAFYEDTQSVAVPTTLVKLYGITKWAFYNCMFAGHSARTIELGAVGTYQVNVTFDTIVDEDPLYDDTIPKYSIYMIDLGGSQPAFKGVHIRNSFIHRIFAQSNQEIDNFVYEGGGYSPSANRAHGTFATIVKILTGLINNSRIAPSAEEKALGYTLGASGSNSNNTILGVMQGGGGVGLNLTGTFAGLLWTDATSGKITASNGFAVTGTGSVFTRYSPTLNGAYVDIATTNAQAVFGVEANTPITVSGASANAAIAGSVANKSLELFTNNIVRGGFLSSGRFKIILANVPVYANNAAAIAGGLAAGEFYRTNADPDVLAIVH